MKKIYVIIGTTRQNRASEGVANWVMKNLPKTKNTQFELVDLRDWPLPFLMKACHHSPLKEIMKTKLA